MEIENEWRNGGWEMEAGAAAELLEMTGWMKARHYIVLLSGDV